MPKRFVNPALSGPLCLVFLISLRSSAFRLLLRHNQGFAVLPPSVSCFCTPMETDCRLSKGDSRLPFRNWTAAGIDINDLFFEYLDLQRNNNAEYRKRLADLLRYKYAKRQVGLIVTVHTDALNFLLNEGKGLFPDAPIFFPIYC